MPRILYVAYHFPPVGGGGVQRNAKFVRYLPAHGFESVVVTGPGGSSDRWAPEDLSLLDDVAGIADVRRVPGPEPAQSGVRASIEWKLMLKNAHVRWWLRGVVDTGFAARGDIDLIYASLIPYETGAAAAELARKLRKPWIADLQDPWALDEMWLYPSAAHRALDMRRMRKVLATAAAIVMNTPEAAARLLRAFPELASRIVVSIPNGFDEADFAGSPRASRRERFRIVHTGYLHTDHGLRLRRTRRLRQLLGGTAPIDILPRSHVYLLRAIDELIAEDPAVAEAVEIVLAGVTTELDRSIAAASAATVELPGYLSHVDTVDLVRSADLLFLPMHELPPGTRAGLVPGKTYEYLAARRPILAAVPDGDARDLLAAAGNAALCRPRDVDSMRTSLAEHLGRWRAGDPVPEPEQSVLARYERRELTRQLAAVFDQVLDCAVES